MPTRKERIEKYEASPKEIQQLYESPLSYALHAEMREKYNIPPEKGGAYLDATGDVVLGFEKIASMPGKFQTKVGLSKEDAQKLTADLIDAWGPVVKREEEEANAKKASMANLANQIEAIKPATPEETVEQHEGVAPLRTMELDTKKAHGYGAAAAASEGITMAPFDAEPVVQATPQDTLQKKIQTANETLSPGTIQPKENDAL